MRTWLKRGVKTVVFAVSPNNFHNHSKQRNSNWRKHLSSSAAPYRSCTLCRLNHLQAELPRPFRTQQCKQRHLRAQMILLLCKCNTTRSYGAVHTNKPARVEAYPFLWQRWRQALQHPLTPQPLICLESPVVVCSEALRHSDSSQRRQMGSIGVFWCWQVDPPDRSTAHDLRLLRCWRRVPADTARLPTELLATSAAQVRFHRRSPCQAALPPFLPLAAITRLQAEAAAPPPH